MRVPDACKADVLFFCVQVACFTSVFLSSAAADTPMITALVVDNRKTQEIDACPSCLHACGVARARKLETDILLAPRV